MATKYWFRKERVRLDPGGVLFNAVVPTTEDGKKWLDSLPVGETVAGQFSRPRNAKFHRKFFALLNLIYQNQSHFKSVDQILLVFKHHIGLGEWVVTRDHNGNRLELFQPGSISFAKMDQAEFENFYQRAIDFVTEKIIPGMDKSELERELRSFAE